MTSKEKTKFRTFLKRKVFKNETFKYSTIKDLVLFIKLYNFKVPNQYPIELMGYSNRNNISTKGLSNIIRKTCKPNDFLSNTFVSHLDLRLIYNCEYIEAVKETIYNKDYSIINFFNCNESPSLEKYKKYKKYLETNKKDMNSGKLEALQIKYGKNKGLEAYNKKCEKCSYTQSKEYLGEEKHKELVKKRTLSLEKMKDKYGEEEGIKKWDDFCKKNSYTNSIESYIEKYGKIEGQKRYNQWKIDIGKSTRVEYFKTDDNTLEEAKELLKKRQTTFSLEICIKKYGKEKGIEKFYERQERWQETLRNKSDEEISRINQLKGSGMNAGWGIQEVRRLGFEESKKKFCRLYYIRFYNNEKEFWKIGITRYTIDKRFGKALIQENKTQLKREVLFEIETNFYDAFFNEQKILRNYKNKRIKINYNSFRSYECFSEDIFKNNYNIILDKGIEWKS